MKKFLLAFIIFAFVNGTLIVHANEERDFLIGEWLDEDGDVWVFEEYGGGFWTGDFMSWSVQDGVISVIVEFLGIEAEFEYEIISDDTFILYYFERELEMFRLRLGFSEWPETPLPEELFGIWLDSEGDFWAFNENGSGLYWSGETMTWAADENVLYLEVDTLGGSFRIIFEYQFEEEFIINFYGEPISLIILETPSYWFGSWTDNDGDIWSFNENNTGLYWTGEDILWGVIENSLVILFEDGGSNTFSYERARHGDMIINFFGRELNFRPTGTVRAFL